MFADRSVVASMWPLRGSMALCRGGDDLDINSPEIISIYSPGSGD